MHSTPLDPSDRTADDGIALLLTPPGSGAIAVLRLTGPRVGAFLRAHFSRPTPPGHCVHGTLAEGSRVIDDPVVVLSDDRRIADLNLHAGPWVIRSAIELAERFGFAVSDPVPLPLPPEAVDADTEIAREILSHLPLATTELALSELLGQRDAWLQFEQLPAAARAAEAAGMQWDQGLRWLLHPPRVAIAGATNVGKSTLANQLFGQERSIAADLHGTTRDWVGEMANVDGLAVLLVDTPGIRRSTDPIEAAAIDRAGEEIQAADLVVLVLDASRPMEPEQSQLMARFPGAMRVVNKCDVAAWDVTSVAGYETVATSGRGVDALRGRIRAHFGIDDRVGKARCWTERQRRLLKAEALSS